MKRQRAVFADDQILSQYGAEKIVTGIDDTMNFSGWTFASSHDKMCTSDDLISLARKIESWLKCPSISADSDNVLIEHLNLRLPPMLFLADIFSVSHMESKFSLSLNAEDALLSWASKHTTEYASKRPLDIVVVPYANLWSQRSLGHVADLSSVVACTDMGTDSNSETCDRPLFPDVRISSSRKWDWTFTSEYCCTISTTCDTVGIDAPKLVVTAPILSEFLNPDRTSTCPSPGIAVTGSNIGEDGVNLVTSEPIFEWDIHRAASSGLDNDMLRATDVPILFYDEVVLYQDDLEDCGDVQFDAKLRVMPTCWFVLSRHFVRVDGALARIRETRLFHAFEAPDAIHMTVTWKEMSLHGIQEVGSVAPSDNTRAGAVGMAVGGGAGSSPGGAASIVPGPPAGGRTGAHTVPPSRSAGPGVMPPGPPGPPHGGGRGRGTDATSMLAQLLRDPAQLSTRMPQVNDRDGIHEYFTIQRKSSPEP